MNPVVAPLITTLGIQVLAALAAFTLPVLAPVAGPDLGLSPNLAGAFVGLVYGGAMIASLASGDLVARYGAIRASQGCLVLCGIGLATTAAASPWLMIASGLLIGLGYGGVTPASSHILAKTTRPEIMSFVFSLKQSGVPVGGALAGALVPTLVLLVGWRGAALAAAAACLVFALIAQPMRARLDGDRVPGRRVSLASMVGPIRLVVSYPLMRELVIASFFFAAIQLCLTTYLVILLTHELGMSLVAAGFTLAIAQAAGVGGRLIWGIAADRMMRARKLLALLGITMGLAAFATAAFSPAWPYAAVAAVSVLFGATAIGWNGVFLAEVAQMAPEGRAGAATGGALCFTYFGIVVGPPAFGLLTTATGSYAMGYFIMGLVVLAMSLALLRRGGPAQKRSG